MAALVSVMKYTDALSGINEIATTLSQYTSQIWGFYLE